MADFFIPSVRWQLEQIWSRRGCRDPLHFLCSARDPVGRVVVYGSRHLNYPRLTPSGSRRKLGLLPRK